MAIYLSDEMTLLADTRRQNLLSATQAGAPIRIYTTRFVVPTGGVAVGDNIHCFTLPKGAKLIGGLLTNSNLASPNTVVISIGTVADPDFFRINYLIAGADAGGLVIMIFPTLPPLPFAGTGGEVISFNVPTIITITPRTNAWVAGKIILADWFVVYA
jgi:hypothetical protein